MHTTGAAGSTTNAMSTNEVSVVSVPPRIDASQFAVALPASIVRGLDDPDVDEGGHMRGLMNGEGVVGTIIYTKNSANVWIGWGRVCSGTTAESVSGNESVGDGTSPRILGKAKNLKMGPLFLAMPRTKYAGAFSSDLDPSTSKLIGCDSEDDEMIARQMGSRLTKRLGFAVFISCSFEGAPSMAKEGVDEKMIQHRAAALAEREVFRILKEKQP